MLESIISVAYDPAWRARFAALRAHPADARAYAARKRALAARFRDDRDASTDAKTDFIAAALAHPADAREGQRPAP